MPDILLIEDNEDIAFSVQFNLQKNAGYAVTIVTDGEEGCIAALRAPPDLILLDLNLPGMDGMEVCRKLRAHPRTATVPIIMLTARTDEIDRVSGLDLGADDYITKPFSLRELKARVQAVLRRTRTDRDAPAEMEVLRYETMEIDRAARTIRIDDHNIELTKIEFDLLVDLFRHQGRVRDRQSLLHAVWGYDDVGNTRTVDVHIRHLRQKLGDDLGAAIETVIGVGYRLRRLESST